MHKILSIRNVILELWQFSHQQVPQLALIAVSRRLRFRIFVFPNMVEHIAFVDVTHNCIRTHGRTHCLRRRNSQLNMGIRKYVGNSRLNYFRFVAFIGTLHKLRIHYHHLETIHTLAIDTNRTLVDRVFHFLRHSLVAYN